MSKAFFVTERRKIRNGKVWAGAENFGQRGAWYLATGGVG